MDEKRDFDALVEELEGIVRRMESADIGLEESMALFERGIGLVKDCQHSLDQAEQKLLALFSKDGEDKLEERDPIESKA